MCILNGKRMKKNQENRNSDTDSDSDKTGDNSKVFKAKRIVCAVAFRFISFQLPFYFIFISMIIRFL